MTDDVKLNQSKAKSKAKSNCEIVEVASVPLQDFKSISPGDSSGQEAFLAHYESFVECSVEDNLLWCSEGFQGHRSSSRVRLYPWVRTGMIGVGAVSVIAIAGTVLSKGATQPTAVAHPDATLNPAPQSPTISPSISSESSPEFSPKASSPEFAKAPVPKVVSPAIRAPLPGQVIGRQLAGVESFSSPPAELSNIAPHWVGIAKSRSAPVKSSPLTPDRLITPERSDSPSKSIALPLRLPELPKSRTTPPPADWTENSAHLKSEATPREPLSPPEKESASKSTPVPPSKISQRDSELSSYELDHSETADFRVFWLSMSDYEQAWTRFNPAEKQTASAYGFMNRSKQIIVLPLPQRWS